MADNFSFDLVSNIDLQEVDNAINQTNKEIENRFDFKGVFKEINRKDYELELITSDEFKLKSIVDILQSKFIKRAISLKSLEYGKAENAFSGNLKQTIKLKNGINQDYAKKINKAIKEQGFKVQTQVQTDQLRVMSKSKDELQKAINFLKNLDIDLDLQFTNYR